MSDSTTLLRLEALEERTERLDQRRDELTSAEGAKRDQFFAEIDSILDECRAIRAEL